MSDARSGSNGNGNGNKSFMETVNSVADNSAMKIFARYVMPIALAVIGWLMVDKLTAIDQGGHETRAAVVELGKKVDGVATASAVTNTELKVLATQVSANRERSDAVAATVENKLQTVNAQTTRDRETLERRIDEMVRAMIGKPMSSSPSSPRLTPN